MTARSQIDVSARRHRLEQRTKAVDLSPGDAPSASVGRPSDTVIVKANEVSPEKYSLAADAFSDNNKNVRRLSNVSLSKWSMPDDHSDDDDDVKPAPPPLQSMRVQVESIEFPAPPPPITSPDYEEVKLPAEPVYAKPQRPRDEKQVRRTKHVSIVDAKLYEVLLTKIRNANRADL